MRSEPICRKAVNGPNTPQIYRNIQQQGLICQFRTLYGVKCNLLKFCTHNFTNHAVCWAGLFIPLFESELSPKQSLLVFTRKTVPQGCFYEDNLSFHACFIGLFPLDVIQLSVFPSICLNQRFFLVKEILDLLIIWSLLQKRLKIGFSQDPEETFAPVAKMTTVHTFISVAAIQ